MGAWSDGLEQHCLEPVLYVIYTYNLSEGAIRLIGFILADARFFSCHVAEELGGGHDGEYGGGHGDGLVGEGE